MPKKIEPYFAFEILRSPPINDDREILLKFLTWLKEFDIQPSGYVYPEKDSEEHYPCTDPVTLVEHYYSEYKHEPEFPRTESSSDRRFLILLKVPWELPKETEVGLFWHTWLKEIQVARDYNVVTKKIMGITQIQPQRDIRVNVSTDTLLIPRSQIPYIITAYDPIAEKGSELALAIHQKLEATITVADSIERVLRPYNPKKAPLWVGWYSVYGRELQGRYHLKDFLPPPKSILCEKKGNDLVFRHNLPYSEHLKQGWDEEARAFWKKVGGRILLGSKDAATRQYEREEKRSASFVVEEVNEKTGTAFLRKVKDITGFFKKKKS